MKIYKWLIPLGRIGVLSFLLLDILGKILWPEYNPITTYMSALLIDEAPNVHLMRLFMNIYTICFFLFSLGMLNLAHIKYHRITKIGYATMFITALISVVGYGGYPISLEELFSKNNIVHLLVTIAIFCGTAISILMIAAGYLKREKMIALGRTCLIFGLLFIALNLWQLYAILHGSHILGLIQRLIFYTFHILTVILSYFYTSEKLSPGM